MLSNKSHHTTHNNGRSMVGKTNKGKNSRNANYQFWRQDNHPQELYSAAFIFQKINYIHNNPVEAGIVEKPE